MNNITDNLIIIKSNRKTMSLSVNDDLQAVVKAPFTVSEAEIKDFVKKHIDWLDEAVKRKEKQLEHYNISQTEREELISLAKKIIPKRVEYFSSVMGVKPSGIKITSAKKRFGSCSSKNSLCFSYYLMKYPPKAIDYVVVHELAHIRHHNHGKEFYALIEKYMPDYKERENLLKNP